METFLEIVKVISPACITGVVTFLVTKYNYYKDIPLDKLELAYNRVYYPIYYVIKYEKVELTQVVEKCEMIFKKYNKYVERSTIIAFEYLKNASNNKKARINFEGNICSINCKLRRRLGYLEPGIFELYTYSKPATRRGFRMSMEIIVLCLILELILIFPNVIFQNVCVSIGAIILMVFGVELFMGIVERVCTKIKLFVVKRRKCNKKIYRLTEK